MYTVISAPYKNALVIVDWNSGRATLGLLTYVPLWWPLLYIWATVCNSIAKGSMYMLHTRQLSWNFRDSPRNWPRVLLSWKHSKLSYHGMRVHN